MKSPYNFLENIEIFSKNMLLKIHMKVKSEKLKSGSELKVQVLHLMISSSRLSFLETLSMWKNILVMIILFYAKRLDNGEVPVLLK